jgi:hypothetical protein
MKLPDLSGALGSTKMQNLAVSQRNHSEAMTPIAKSLVCARVSPLDRALYSSVSVRIVEKVSNGLPPGLSVTLTYSKERLLSMCAFTKLINNQVAK